MKTYKERITECIGYLLSIRFPCNDWKEDKDCFDKMEKEFSAFPADEETKVLHGTINGPDSRKAGLKPELQQDHRGTVCGLE